MNTGDRGEKLEDQLRATANCGLARDGRGSETSNSRIFSGYITVNELSGPDPAAIALMSEGEPPR